MKKDRKNHLFYPFFTKKTLIWENQKLSVTLRRFKSERY